MRTGYLGGSFDPVHVGHVGLARDLARARALDRVVVVPAGRSPHKDACHASADDRLAMLRLALGDDPLFAIDDRELGRPGPSYTIDTMSRIAAERPDETRYFLMGMDALRDLPRWRRVEELARLVVFLVAQRPGEDAGAARRVADAAGFLRYEVVPTAARAVSSSELRRALARGEDVADRLDPAVLAHIQRRGLYRED